MRSLLYQDYVDALARGNADALLRYLSHKDSHVSTHIEEQMYGALLVLPEKLLPVDHHFVRVLKEHVDKGLRDEASIKVIIDAALKP